MKWVILSICLLVGTTAEAKSLNGIIFSLQRECGAKIGPRVVQKNVAGTRMRSCHATGEAVDVTGNYSCIYRVLRGWPGGYTTDAGRCKHVHISSCRREWGLRFKHGSC